MTPDSAARQVAKAVFARVARIVLVAMTGIALARVLGPAGTGTYSLAVAVAGATMALGHLSVEQAQVALWTRAEMDRSALAGNALALGLGGGAAAAAVAAAVSTGPAVFAALAAMPLVMTVVYLNNIAVLRGRVDAVNRGGLLGAAGQCAAVLLLALGGLLNVSWAVVLWALAAAAPLFVVLPVVRPRLADSDRAMARVVLTTGLPYHLGLTALYLLTRVDVLILGALVPVAAVGLYVLAVMIGELSRIVTDALSQVLLARQMDGDLAHSALLTLRMLRLGTLVSAAAVGLLCLFAPLAVPLVYGSAFAGSVPALWALAPGLFLLAAGRPVGAYLLRLDRPWRASAITCAAVAVNVAADLLLIPRWGIVGCALSASLGYTVLVAVRAVWFLRAAGARLPEVLPGAADLRYLGRTARRLLTPA